MLTNRSPYDSDNSIIAQARQATQIYIEEIAKAGKLQAAALNPSAIVTEIAYHVLGEYLVTAQITITMVERWVAESISNLASGYWRPFTPASIECIPLGFTDPVLTFVYRGTTTDGQVLLVLADVLEMNLGKFPIHELYNPDEWLDSIDGETCWKEGE